MAAWLDLMTVDDWVPTLAAWSAGQWVSLMAVWTVDTMDYTQVA